MRRLLTVLFASFALCAGAAWAQAPGGRVIVKYKATDAALKQALAADRTDRLSARIGVRLVRGSMLHERAEVVTASGVDSDELARRLSAQADVEYAVPDRRRTIRALPNDPLHATQWYHQPITAAPAAIDAVTAWDSTTGDASIVVAFVDTGVRYDHPDLANRLLPGYDFISDRVNAGDGDSRDADASDAGDFISAADVADPAVKAACGDDLEVQDSSWHGTRVAGIIGAEGNNSIGIAGINWRVGLLPVRVLGKCGGYDSDIIAGTRWAAGGTVPGVPANPNPARIVSLSLGGAGACAASYLDLLNELNARGVLMVVAAGNSSGPVAEPANCVGVLAVGGVRHVGTKVGYSSLGPEVGISAPAGNCVNASGACLFSIRTTTNLGATTPAANGYTDEFNFNVGTSFSAPQVSAVAALMLAANPALAPADIIRRIQRTARSFPADALLPTCPTLAEGELTQGQCNCTTSTCGAGLLDAAASVREALPPVARIVASGTLVAGNVITLDGGGSTAAPGLTVSTWVWQLASSPAGSGAALSRLDSAATSFQATVAGTYVVRLTVTDSLGASASTQSDVVIEAAPVVIVTPPASSGGGGGGGGGAWGLVDLALLLALGAFAYRARRSSAQTLPPTRP